MKPALYAHTAHMLHALDHSIHTHNTLLPNQHTSVTLHFLFRHI